MKSMGRFEIKDPVVTGVVETFTGRDPSSDTTVLVHVLPAGCSDAPEKKFLEFAPGCPGKILDSGVDSETQRGFVVTDYPKDRKALLLWIKSLSGVGTKKPAAAPQPKPAPQPPSKPAAPPASDGATRMFDPAAMFGGLPPAAPAKAAPVPAPEPPKAAPAGDGATRMFDPAAIFGDAPAAAAPAAEVKAAPAGADGATKMFDPSAMFGGVPSTPAATPSAPTPPARKTPPPPTHEHKHTTDPFADLKAALTRTSAPPPEPAASGPAKPAGEFTRRFELPKQFRNAPLRVDRTKGGSGKSEPGVHKETPGANKGVFTLMMEAYGSRLDQPKKPEAPAKPPEAAPPSAAPGPSSDGATRMFDPSALFGGPPASQETAPPPPAEPTKPAETPAGYQPTVRMPALKRDDEDEKTSR